MNAPTAGTLQMGGSTEISVQSAIKYIGNARMTLIYILVPTRSGNSSNTTLKIKFWFF
jgi:hypothetical protein